MPRMRLTCGPVRLRLITPRSAHQLYTLAREPAVSEFLQWEAHRSIDDSLEYIHDTQRLWRRHVAFLFGIFDERERLLGSTGISHLDRANRRAEVGTWIGTPHQGQGLNRYLKSAVFTFGFNILALHRLELVVRTDNLHSLASTAKMPGIVDEGVQHKRLWKGGAPSDAHMLAITTDTWKASEYEPVLIEGALV